MAIKEIIIVLIYLLILLIAAYFVRPYVTNRTTVRYFIPSLSVKLIGAIAVGLIYQFYYQGGDTLNYHFRGATQIWNAFLDSPILAFKLIFLQGAEYESSTFQYASQILSYGDLPTYFVVRVAGLFSLLTINSYYGNSLLFAAFSFAGVWAMFISFYKILPKQHLLIAIASLFIPSVFFWGSGLLKDTITFGATCWLVYSFLEIFINRNRSLLHFIILISSCYVLFLVKIYIALSLIPALIIFLFIRGLPRIKNIIVKVLMGPILIVMAVSAGFYAVLTVGELNQKYSMEEFLNTARVSAEWLYYVSQREGGSGYTLGTTDFTTSGMLSKFFPAVWVSLFRPYLWEAYNPVMLMSALESTLMLLVCLFLILRMGPFRYVKTVLSSPLAISLLLFSISFAFAIGFSTYNFGSLVRYKIPMIPLFLFALILVWDKYIESKKHFPQ